MRDELQAVYDKIEALLNRTTANGCTEAEAESAAFLVQQLLTKYNLELKNMKFEDRSKPNIGRTYTRYDEKLKFRRFEWVAWMATGVAEMCFVKYYYLERSKAIQWLGEEQDVKIAETMLNWLVDQAFTRCKYEWSTGKKTIYAHLTYLPFENAFLHGFGQHMYDKIHYICIEREKQVAGVPGLVVDKKAQIEEFLAEEHRQWAIKYPPIPVQDNPKKKPSKKKPPKIKYRKPPREKCYNYDRIAFTSGAVNAKETHIHKLEELE